MNFNKHFDIEGSHAFLGPSKYHWIRYDEDKLVDSYLNHMTKQKGIELHDLACNCIKLEQKLPNSKKTLNMYVNDAIGFKMSPEQPLMYSYNCFGTADTISFRKNVLRIHDLKTGVTPAHMDQLKVYAALFCLEYKCKPSEIEMELRIYQNDEVLFDRPPAEEILEIMEKIIIFDKLISNIQSEEV